MNKLYYTCSLNGLYKFNEITLSYKQDTISSNGSFSIHNIREQGRRWGLLENEFSQNN